MLAHQQNIAIAGAGIGGHAAASLLARDGHHVVIFDQFVHASPLKPRALPYGAISGTVDWPQNTTLDHDKLTQMYRRADRMVGARRHDCPLGTPWENAIDLRQTSRFHSTPAPYKNNTTIKVTPMTTFNAMPPRFDVSAAQIDAMMQAFYVEIRTHPVLGPVFNDRINDWPSHEAKIASFWRNAILHERSYDGRPQQVHMATKSVMPEHFPIWLDLFEDVAGRVLPPTASVPWVALARRIGDGMQIGVAQVRAKPGAVPIL